MMDKNNKFNIIILAAGKGTRMKSFLPKVMVEAAGLPLIDYAIDLSLSLKPEKVILILGHCADTILAHVNNKYKEEKNIEVAIQKEQLGTADAVLTAKEYLKEAGHSLILCGDMPHISKETLENFIKASKGEKVSFISTKLENPFGYGRVIKSTDKKVIKIVEEKDAQEIEKKVTEVNTGVYFCENKELLKRLSKVNNKNKQKEYYLTDIVQGGSSCFLSESKNEFIGINDRYQLALSSKIIYKERVKKHAENGVTFLDTDSAYLDYNIEIGADSIIYPNVFIKNGSKLGKNVTVQQGVLIDNSKIDDDCVIKANSFIEESSIGEKSIIGPMAHLRPHSLLKGDNKVGNFVELKKATLDIGAKASHLTYLGDATLGKDVNIGCGTITCNYDGFNKYETIIGDNVFVGSDTQFVAPVKVGNNALIAAGSTITQDVPSGALALSRIEQKNMEEKALDIMKRNKEKKGKEKNGRSNKK